MRKQYLALVRHAQSEANLRLAKTPDGLYYSLSGSDPSVPLTRLGRRQARNAGRLLARLFPRQRPLLRIYHTHYARVTQTMSRIRGNLGYRVEPVCDHRLSKRNYGKFWNLTHNGVEQLFPEEWLRYLADGEMFYRPPEGGENYPDVFARADNFFEEVLLPNPQNTVIVTHSLVVLALMRRLEGLSDDEAVTQYNESSLQNAQVIVYCRRLSRKGKPLSDWQRCDLETSEPPVCGP